MLWSFNSLPPTCVGGKPYPNCGYTGTPYTGRGIDVNPQTCKCIPACPLGKYYLGPPNKCGTKAQQDTVNAADQVMLNCINRGGTWDDNNRRCIGGSGSGGSSGGLDINPNLIIGGLAVLLLLSLLSK